jgi:hypothetical protein
VAPSHSFGTEGMAAGPPNSKCFKKEFQKIKKIKKFKVGGPAAIPSVPKLWLGARRTWNALRIF